MSVDSDLGALRAAVEEFGVANRRVAEVIGMNPLDLVIRSGRDTVADFLIRRGQDELFAEWERRLLAVQRLREDVSPLEDSGAFLVLLAAHFAASAAETSPEISPMA